MGWTGALEVFLVMLTGAFVGAIGGHIVGRALAIRMSRRTNQFVLDKLRSSLPLGLCAICRRRTLDFLDYLGDHPHIAHIALRRIFDLEHDRPSELN
jgi:hypothetical protein